MLEDWPRRTPVGHRPDACELYNQSERQVRKCGEVGGSFSVACRSLVADRTKAIVEHALHRVRAAFVRLASYGPGSALTC